VAYTENTYFFYLLQDAMNYLVYGTLFFTSYFIAAGRPAEYLGCYRYSVL
jgi:hypothetical protein